jgi:hypothetical protein
MVHGGPWTEAWPELAGVIAHRCCSGPELTAAIPKQSGCLSGPHQGLRQPARWRGKAGGEEELTVAVELDVERVEA